MNKLMLLLFLLSGFALAGCMTMAITFYTAYSAPAKATIVYINNYGEADIEAFFVMPLILISSIIVFLASGYLHWKSYEVET